MNKTCTLTDREWALVLQTLVHRRMQTTSPDLMRRLIEVEEKIDAVVRT